MYAGRLFFRTVTTVGPKREMNETVVLRNPNTSLAETPTIMS